MKKTHLLLAAFFLNSAYYFSQQTKKENDKETKIQEVNIIKTKKAVEQRADRTIFDFSEQPSLNSGTVMEGIKKLPGLIVSDVAGMMYQGKMLAVYMDGRPLNINSTELNAFLEGMPANSVERVEIITQPGAEFPATSGGAIINIITSKNAKNYLTATYSGNYNFTDYDKWRNRVSNSINLNAKNRYFGWQLNFGQNYRENMMDANQDNLVATHSDRIGRGYFAKAALTFDLGVDRLLINYDFYKNNNDNTIFSNGTFGGNPYTSTDFSNTLMDRNEAVATYQKRFLDKEKKLDFKLAYSGIKTDFAQDNLDKNKDVLDNSSNMKDVTFKIDYSQPLRILDSGKFSFGGLYERQKYTTASKGLTNLDYQNQTTATYLELQAKLKKMDFILGARAEGYDVSGTTYNYNTNQYTALIPFNKYKVFPNASFQYHFMPQVQFSLNYNKKISLPSVSLLNPNNTTFQGPNSSFNGNPALQPTLYHNYEAKLSAFDFAFIGYSVSQAKNQVVQKLNRVGDVITNTQANVSDIKIHNLNIGLPLPFMIFSKSIKEMMKFNFNIDKMNYLYFYAAYQYQQIPDIQTKGFWIFAINSQIILPKDIKFTANYVYLTPHGSYYYFVADKPLNNSLSLNLSKKFMKDRLTVSLFADDIFNTQNQALHSVAQTPYVYFSQKTDTRRYGISINYKIPTKNKLAKEAPNMLNQEKKSSDSGDLLKQGQ